MDLQTCRNDESTDDHFKSDFNLVSEGGDIEGLLDCLNAVVDWQQMEKGDVKDAGTLLCSDVRPTRHHEAGR